MKDFFGFKNAYIEELEQALHELLIQTKRAKRRTAPKEETMSAKEDVSNVSALQLGVQHRGQ